VSPLPLNETVSRRLAGAPPGPRKREQRSGEILDAAAALFVEKGVTATSIDDIVERAGVAKGTFYHYFQDRAAMLEALRRRFSQHFAEAAGCATEACREDDWPARLDAWITAVSAQYIATYALHDAIFHDAAVSHRCAMSEEPALQALAELLARGRDAGAWTLDQPMTVALVIFHGLHGLVDEAIATGGDTQAIAGQLSRLFAAMLRI
jgi:AcrR family transcriptional regulator